MRLPTCLILPVLLLLTVGCGAPVDVVLSSAHVGVSPEPAAVAHRKAAFADAVSIQFRAENLQYTDLGSTVVLGARNFGIVGLRTRGLQGEGTITCNGDPDCVAAGLEGETMSIVQDIQLSADVNLGGSVRGYTQGTITLPGRNGISFWGPVAGRCVWDDPEICHLQLRASTRLGTSGTLQQGLIGSLTRDGWVSLGGVAVISWAGANS